MLAKLIARVGLSRRSGQTWLNNLEGAYDNLDAAAARQIVVESGANWLIKQLQVLKSYSAKGWQPRIHLQGHEHIDAALVAGKGVILWNSPFRFADLIGKIGIHEAGYPLTHLSTLGHPWSDSRFGVRYLNPIWVRVEQRYLLQRVVIDPADPKQALDRLRSVLCANGIVSISAVRGVARKPIKIRLLNANFSLGLGAPLLAYDTGAALLPMFVSHQRDGSFRLVVEDPISIPAAEPRIEAAIVASQTFAKRTETHLQVAPEQWSWSTMEPIGLE
jgi:hypothetical protein